MEIATQVYNKNDSRIFLASYITEKGDTEIYPLGSFPFDYFLYFEWKPMTIFTATTYSPNTFLCELPTEDTSKTLASVSTSRVGLSYGFSFFESTLWNGAKVQKGITPLVYTVQTYNIFHNLRWCFFVQVNTTYLHSLTFTYPSSAWSEREVQDMYLVKFKGLKDGRRLLLDYKTPRGVLSPNQCKTILPTYSSFFDLYYV